MNEAVEKGPWDALQRFTNARIALGRTGDSLPTAPLLAFNLAHAQARDAVHQPFAAEAVHQRLREAGLATLDVHSAASDRQIYLRRPDLGRRLSSASAAELAQAGQTSITPPDVIFVIADGLSACAAERQALPLLMALLPQLTDWRVGPIVVARQARVALGDAIGECLHARLIAMLIGERPGLSAPDSLGAYLTYAPRIGCHDAHRNCISNIRPEGLSHAAAAHKLHYLLTQARRLKLTGIGLKDESETLPENQEKIRLNP